MPDLQATLAIVTDETLDVTQFMGGEADRAGEAERL
jgi:hypothetical protein